MNLILNLFKILTKFNIIGLDAILFIIYYLVIYKSNLFNKELVDKNDIKNTFLYLNKKYNINNFDVNIDCINQLLQSNIEINLKSFINNIFDTCVQNENLIIMRDYFKYNTNPILNEWISKLPENIINKTIFDGNMNINSFSNYIDKSNNVFYGNQSNVVVKNILNIKKIINNENYTILSKDIIYDDYNDLKYDLIFFDFLTNIHNINHASCCKKIKDLKIRGTKAEPLLLQWVLMSLQKNGEAILVIPDSLLFSSSNQHIETRKFLLENYNIKKIIELDESVYIHSTIKRDISSITSCIKNSILYIENKPNVKNIIISKIILENNKIVELPITNLIDINDNYSLYYKNYINTKINNDIIYKKIDDLFDFNINNDSKQVLKVSKYYNESSINIIDHQTNQQDENYTKNFILISEKQNNYVSNFLLIYLKSLLCNKYEYFVKGKMKQFEIKKIKEFEIPILPIDKQQSIINYLLLHNQIINDNTTKIQSYKDLQYNIMNTIPTNNLIEIKDICNISNKSCNYIFMNILQNSSLAGSVSFSKNYLNNAYNLTLFNTNFLEKYIYYYLKYIEPKIKDLAKQTLQPSLSNKNVLLLTISNISIQKQIIIIDYCDSMNENIKMYENNNSNIKDKNIINVVIELYN